MSGMGRTGGGVLNYVLCYLWMLGQQCLQILKWWQQLHSLSMRDQHWTWQWQRETMEEASPHQPDSFGRGPPWRWCPSAQPSWSIGPLVPEPFWIASPHSSWSTIPVWGPAPIWTLAWVASCNCLKTRLKPSASSACTLASLLELEEMIGEWQWQKVGQMVFLFWALPQWLHKEWVNV